MRVALAGLAAAWRYEVPFRLEVVVFVLLLPIAVYAGQTALERVLLVATLVLVLIVELVNSALEARLDRTSLEDHPLNKRAKDISSAAVGLALVHAALIWLGVLFG